jgi:CDP-4-dehydro-6-deoxyglucose reductase, E1
MTFILPLASDSFEEQEKQAMHSVIESGQYTMGEKVAEFEKLFAEWIGASDSVMVNSGSSANLLLVYSQLISSFKTDLLQPGDEVLVPALLWPTTIWPLTQFGLKPVLVDIDLTSLAIDLKDSKEKLTSRTKAVFLIHVLGYACEMDEYVKFCQENNLLLMEDCCESFGAFDSGSHVGTFGVGGTFSHFFSHHLTTMEGGSIVVNSPDLADDLRSMRAHGWIRNRSDVAKMANKYPSLDPRFLFHMPGFNLRPMEIQAAVGLVQLDKIDSLLSHRDAFAQYVVDAFQIISWLRIPGSERSAIHVDRNKRNHSWMNIPFMLKENSPVSLGYVMDVFQKEGIETRPIITGNFANQPASEYLSGLGEYPNAETITNQGFMIGCHASEMSNLVSKTITQVANRLSLL